MASEKDLREPIKIKGQGVCPECREANMVLNQYGSDHIFLDENGIPVYSNSVTKEFLVCPKCGYVGQIGKDYVKLEDGSFKWVTEAEKIYEEDRMSSLPPIKHFNAGKNPFMNLEEDNDGKES